MARKQPPLSDLERAKKTSFTAGYVLACANIVNLHDEFVIAEDALAESGITLAEVKALGLTEYDMKPLRALFLEIARKRRLGKERRTRASDPSARPAPLAREGNHG